jgi:hypothetical protein
MIAARVVSVGEPTHSFALLRCLRPDAAAANDGASPTFQERWRPPSVVMANFEQRVRESGFTLQLFVRSVSIGSNDEHFWFIPFASSQGYILPAKRLLQHRAALRGDGRQNCFA